MEPNDETIKKFKSIVEQYCKINLNVKPSKAVETLSQQINSLVVVKRSQVGVQKMEQAMEEHKVKAGVMVFGEGHTKSILEALKKSKKFNVVVMVNKIARRLGRIGL